jgi:dUTP pyrophosphatase
MDVAFRMHDPRAIEPRYAHVNDAGLDLFCLEEHTFSPGATERVDTGVSFDIPPGYQGEVRPRSGLTLRGLTVFQGTIDSGYMGTVRVLVEARHGPVTVPYGVAIAQLVVQPVTRAVLRRAAGVSSSPRGAGGFGSTDRVVDPGARKG